MNALQRLSRTFSFTILLGLLAAPGALLAQNQTNDPLVDQQQYLFDVHNVDQAWNYTTGSSNVTVGLYSMLGFIQNHEDLAGSRLKSPVGSLLKPKLDVASHIAGIIGATTNNGVGMAGIDRAAQLQSYSALRSTDDGGNGISSITVDHPDGGTETYFLDLYRFNEMVEQGRSNGVDVHLFSFGLPSAVPLDYPTGDQVPDFKDPLNLPGPPSLPNNWWGLVKETAPVAAKQANKTNEACTDIFPFTILLGDCSSRKANPYQQFSEILGIAVSNDGAVVVGAAGDLNQSGDVPPIGFTPGLRDRYAVTVGGIELNANDQRVPWDRTRPAPYVDVAGFAENVVGPSGAGSDQYNTSFSSTAASASIGAGVASLLKAEMPGLTSEDVDQILRRTARDAGDPGEDDATGAGAIDAGAALAYVRNKDVQHTTQTVDHVISDQVIKKDVDLRGSGYWDYVGRSCGSGRLEVEGDLHKFEAYVPYSQTFKNIPDAWVRWGQSNGVKSFRDGGIAWFGPFQKRLRVIDVDGRGFTVEGYYWISDFWDRSNNLCAHNIRIPKRPGDFKIAYTAVGTEGPPVNASISGPDVLSSGEEGTWTASVSGGSGSTSYDWKYYYGAYWSDASCTGSSCSRSFNNSGYGPIDAKMRVVVTKGGQVDSATTVTTIEDDGSSGCTTFPCTFARGNRLVVESMEAEAEDRRARVTWRMKGTVPSSGFTVQHRADSLGSWKTLGKIRAADSIQTAPETGVGYRFRTEELAVGKHEFRLEVDMRNRQTKLHSAPVRASIRLSEAYDLAAYPNPVRNQATVELAVKKSQEIRVGVFDILGRRLATLHQGRIPSQETMQFALDASNIGLTSGPYFVRVQGDTFTATRRITVVR